MAETFGDFTLEASPAVTDYLVGYRTAIAGGERRTTLNSLNSLFQANITAGLTAGRVLVSGATSNLEASDLSYSTPTLTVPASFGITGAGSLAFTAGGSNQNITLTPSGTGLILGQFNTSVTSPGVNGLHLMGKDASIIAYSADGYASAPLLIFRRANGTAAAPSATAADENLGQIGGRGYGTAFTGNRVNINLQASQLWTAANNGTRIVFGVTPNNTTAISNFLVADQDLALKFATGSAGLQLYNTADQTTNYERLEALWTGNVGTIRTVVGGSGTARNLFLSANAFGTITLRTTGSASGTVQLGAVSTATAGAIGYNLGGHGSTAASGDNVGLLVQSTVNQSSTAAYTDFRVNRSTQTAVGSGAQLLADFQVGGTSKFSVSNVGAAILGHTSNPILSVTDGSTSAFMDVNTAGFRARFGTAANVAVDILQAGGTAILIGTSKQVTFPGALITTPQALSGAGAVNTTTTATDYTSTGGAQALTLANGTVGQFKTISHVVDGGSGVLTPTTAIGFTTVTFTNVGDSVTLRYTSAGWAIVGIFGAVAA